MNNITNPQTEKEILRDLILQFLGVIFIMVIGVLFKLDIINLDSLNINIPAPIATLSPPWPIILVSLFLLILFWSWKKIKVLLYQKRDPYFSMMVETKDKALEYASIEKPGPKSRLHWKVKFDDILLVTVSHPFGDIIKLEDRYAHLSENMVSKEAGLKSCYRYMHFFDKKGNQYLLDQFHGVKGLFDVFPDLQTALGIKQNMIEEIEKESKILYPENLRKRIPHAKDIFDGLDIILMKFIYFFSFNHPKKAILTSDMLNLAREQALIREIGNETT